MATNCVPDADEVLTVKDEGTLYMYAVRSDQSVIDETWVQSDYWVTVGDSQTA